jgi:hypothetical protein
MRMRWCLGREIRRLRQDHHLLPPTSPPTRPNSANPRMPTSAAMTSCGASTTITDYSSPPPPPEPPLPCPTGTMDYDGDRLAEESRRDRRGSLLALMRERKRRVGVVRQALDSGRLTSSVAAPVPRKAKNPWVGNEEVVDTPAMFAEPSPPRQQQHSTYRSTHIPHHPLAIPA